MNNYLWACWFLGKNLSNFVPPIWKLHNPYCHTIQHAIDKITHFWCSSHILSLWQYWSRGYQGPLKKSCAQLCKKSPGKKNRFIKRPYKIQLSILYITKQVYRVWHYRLWSFKTRDTKLERFLHKNQHTQRKFFEFWELD